MQYTKQDVLGSLEKSLMLDGASVSIVERTIDGQLAHLEMEFDGSEVNFHAVPLNGMLVAFKHELNDIPNDQVWKEEQFDYFLRAVDKHYSLVMDESLPDELRTDLEQDWSIIENELLRMKLGLKKD